MGDYIAKQITRLLREQKDRRRWMAVSLLLALAVGLGTVAVFTKPGESRTHTVRVLRCPVTETVAHTHNDDCYDEDGALVCALSVRPLHQHTEECYAFERVLVCGGGGRGPHSR